MNPIIREETEDDVGEVRYIFYEAWKDTYPNEKAGITLDDVEHFYKDRFTEEGLKKSIEQFNDQPKNSKYLVAEVDKKLVGVCSLVKHEDKNQLQAIYVLPEFHGKGIGTMFWDEALRYFDKTKETIVHVVDYNEKAIGFYKKLGFEDTGKRFSEERFILKSGNKFVEMEMSIPAGNLK